MNKFTPSQWVQLHLRVTWMLRPNSVAFLPYFSPQSGATSFPWAALTNSLLGVSAFTSNKSAFTLKFTLDVTN